MKSLAVFAIAVVILAQVPLAVAHPHATVDLMESHSHYIHDDNFQKNFVVHTFEDVIIAAIDFIKMILFSRI